MIIIQRERSLRRGQPMVRLDGGGLAGRDSNWTLTFRRIYSSCNLTPLNDFQWGVLWTHEV